jgi:hypothetical protein
MNDLTELRDFGRDLDRQIPGPSAELRHRVLGAFAEPQRRARQPLPRFRITRRVAIGGGLAMALAAGLLIAPALPWWGGPAAVDAQAAQILDRAALAARHQPVLTARPSQFVFVETLEAGAMISVSPNGSNSVTIERYLREVWLSASGTKDGLLREQPRSSPLPGHPTGPWQTITLTGHQQPAYLPGLPTSPDAMLRYLYRNSQGQNPPDQQAFITAGDLIRESYLRPAALAALFEAVARIPGVVVVHGAVTVSGTRGIAVQRIFQGQSNQLIFDPRTYAFIGERQVVVRGLPGIKAGTVMDFTAVLKVAIVDHTGQQPRS